MRIHLKVIKPRMHQNFIGYGVWIDDEYTAFEAHEFDRACDYFDSAVALGLVREEGRVIGWCDWDDYVELYNDSEVMKSCK